MQNGVLTVVLTEPQVVELCQRAASIADYQVTIDLEKKQVTDGQGFSTSFQVEDSVRHRLLEGLDDIGLTLQHEAEITAYEARHP